MYLGTQRSFRGAPREAMVRTGAERAIVRAELRGEASPTLVEAEIVLAGRSRTQVNRKTASGRKDLAVAAPVHHLLAGGPGPGEWGTQGPPRAPRRRPRAWSTPKGPGRPTRWNGCCANAPPCCARRGGGSARDVASTLDVWDQRLADAGKILVTARERLVSALDEFVGPAYGRLAGVPDQLLVSQQYVRSWIGELLDALVEHRTDDLRRGVNTVGPHRDDLVLTLEGREARTHASQGEQRCLALALRIGVHQLVVLETALTPILLLDDVFSELDPARSRALVAELPPGQSILTTAAPLPGRASTWPGSSTSPRWCRAREPRSPPAAERARRRSPAGGPGHRQGAQPHRRLAVAPDHGAGVHPLGGAGRDRAGGALCSRCACRIRPWWWAPTTRPGPPGRGWSPSGSWPRAPVGRHHH